MNWSIIFDWHTPSGLRPDWGRRRLPACRIPLTVWVRSWYLSTGPLPSELGSSPKLWHSLRLMDRAVRAYRWKLPRFAGLGQLSLWCCRTGNDHLSILIRSYRHHELEVGGLFILGVQQFATPDRQLLLEAWLVFFTLSLLGLGELQDDLLVAGAIDDILVLDPEPIQGILGIPGDFFIFRHH